MERFVHLMSTKSYVTDQKLQIRLEISTDPTMNLLKKQIQNGLARTHISRSAGFYQDEHELTTQES